MLFMLVDTFTLHMLTPKGPRVFKWKNGQNYPLLTAFDCKILKLTLAASTP
jgi:hypothetical protein